ncbi:MAG: hypothetical protein OEW29_11615, partial [Acidimicrobiia bacterium]|nr:hypothetical protein [Acidimicrobiia bacterium]
RGGSWPVLDAPEIPIEFQVAQVPETFLVSPAGQVVQHYEGGITADEIQATVAELSTTDSSGVGQP